MRLSITCFDQGCDCAGCYHSCYRSTHGPSPAQKPSEQFVSSFVYILMIVMVTLRISPYRNLWVEDVDPSAFLANSPGDTNAMAAVEEDKDDDKNVDVGDVLEDETEDGLEDGANSANSGSPVMAVLPLAAAVDIIAGGDSGSLTLTLNLCSSPTRLPVWLEMSMLR